jgi:hypothetical protein
MPQFDFILVKPKVFFGLSGFYLFYFFRVKFYLVQFSSFENASKTTQLHSKEKKLISQ